MKSNKTLEVNFLVYVERKIFVVVGHVKNYVSFIRGSRALYSQMCNSDGRITIRPTN